MEVVKRIQVLGMLKGGYHISVYIGDHAKLAVEKRAQVIYATEMTYPITITQEVVEKMVVLGWPESEMLKMVLPGLIGLTTVSKSLTWDNIFP